MGKLINISTGNYFNRTIRAFGYLASSMGVIHLIIENYIIGLFFLAIGIFLSFSQSRLQMNSDDKTYRNRILFIVLFSGKWKSFENYPYISILGANLTTITYGRANTNIVSNDKVFNICLLSRTHRQKLLVNQFKDLELAKTELKKLSESLSVEIVRYNPMRNKNTIRKR